MAEIVKAGAFATEGERRAAGELANLPADWIVICNKVLPTANGRTFEIDFIVIGKRHVFLIDEKSWYGQIRGSDQIWVRAQQIRERLALGVLRSDGVFINSPAGTLSVVESHYLHAYVEPQLFDMGTCVILFCPCTTCN